MSERRTSWDNTFGIKVWCYCELLPEYIGNLQNRLGTWWKCIWNIRKPKNSTPSPKEKTLSLLDVGYITSFLSRISLPTVACRHFQPRLPNGMEIQLGALCEHPQSSIFFLFGDGLHWLVHHKKMWSGSGHAQNIVNFSCGLSV